MQRATPFELSARQNFLPASSNRDVFFVLLNSCVLGVYHGVHAIPEQSLPEFRRYPALDPRRFTRHETFCHQSRGCVSDFAGSCIFHTRRRRLQVTESLALRGVVSMFLGAIFLVRSPLTPARSQRRVALAGTVPFAVLAVVLMRLVLRSRRWKTATGKEEMIGSRGVAIGPLAAGAEGMGSRARRAVEG